MKEITNGRLFQTLESGQQVSENCLGYITRQSDQQSNSLDGDHGHWIRLWNEC